MRHMKLISALVITLQWMLLVMPAAAEETNTVKNSLKMHFAGSAGSKFALLVMGTENGEYTLDWGDGKLLPDNSPPQPPLYTANCRART